MKVVIRGVHVSLTDALKQHVMEQLAEPLQRLLPREAAELDVQLVETNQAQKRGIDKECRITLHIPNAPAVHLVEATDDFYKAVSLASDRLQVAAKRHLERHRSHDTERISELP